jgi:hypothetical protein
MAVGPFSLWLIKQLGSFAAKPAGNYLSKAILGDPVERALRAPTEAALVAAVDAVLGAKAEEHRDRVIEVIGMFLKKDEVTVTPLIPPRQRGTISGALQSIVSQAVFRAAAPVEGFSDGYLPTSALTALTDELGIEFDGSVFTAAFVEAWIVAVKAAASTTKPELEPLANQLNHERTQTGLEKLEARLVELEVVALQSAYQQGLRDGDQLTARRYQWFEFHIEPIDKLMNEINDDYRSGFRITAQALRSGVGLEQAMFDLQALQDRRRGARWTAVATAQRHMKDSTGGLFGEPIDTLLAEYFKAVRNFQLADGSLYETWYAHYIEEFRNLLLMRADPHHRGNYSGIAGDHDLKKPTAVALEVVLDKGLPNKWNIYAEAYAQLRSAFD